MAQPPANLSPRRPDSPRPPRTPLERSFWPSLALMAGVLVGLMLLVRLRLPPLPFGLVVVLGIWIICYIGVFFWQARAGRPPE